MFCRSKFILVLAICLGLLGTAGRVRAGGDEVVVVYNSAVPASRAVAEHYAQARHVPRNQVVGFSLTTGQDMSREDFRTELQEPLAQMLEDRGWWQMGDIAVPDFHGFPQHLSRLVVSTKIRYLVLCYGVPIRISEDNTVQEYVPTNMPSVYHVNRASVDSELVWLPLWKMNLPLTGPMPNWVYAATNQTKMNPTNGVLLVARLDGPTPEIASGLVDKALVAERDGLWGRAYCDARGLNPTSNYHYGDMLMEGAADICRQLGFETTLDTNAATFSAATPLSHIAIYCGWYDYNVSGPFTLPKVEFMPGAFAYHLHSFSAANLRSATDNWVGPLLAKGATCTMGCVSEPYLVLTPDIDVFLRTLSHGWTFGEAAWAAQPALSWQTTVLGDPLYCPFAKRPIQWYNELMARKSPLVDWVLLRMMDLDLAHGAPPAQVQAALEQWPNSGKNPVLAEKLAEMSDEQGKPSAAIDYYQRALTLQPSRQQRIGLRLALGTRLQAQNRVAEAIKNYQALLDEVPDYAGKSAIEATLNRLAPNPTNPAAAPNPKH